MDEIRGLVKVIVGGCRQGGVNVPDVLAAFIARTVIESSAIRFSNNKEILPEDAEEVVLRSIEKLLERDSPQLETIKMQVFYDETTAIEERVCKKAIHSRNKMVAAHIFGVFELSNSAAETEGDFETLTRLYRRIFRYLLDFPPYPKHGVKAIEKEVAAALESVFPRVGLRAFIQLENDEKKAQLMELGRIIIGIRLLNRLQGKGGGGLEDLDVEGASLSVSLQESLETDMAELLSQCARYHAIIIRTHLAHARRDVAEQTPEMVAARKTALSLADRWAQELANKRQLCGLMSAVLDEVKGISSTIKELLGSLALEREAVRAMVTGRTSVPKEEVYPRFNSMGDLWVKTYESLLALQARKVVYTGLAQFKTSFSSTLPEASHPLMQEVEGDELAEALAEMAQLDAKSSLQAPVTGTDEPVEEPSLEQEQDSGEEKATLLSIHTTQSFLTLPLELQGYCPFTMVHSRGLLVPGRPTLGVIQYAGGYYVCDHDKGVEAFLRAPASYLAHIKDLALASPEYIHLLRVQRWFPQAAIRRLLAPEEELEGGMPAGRVPMRDAATETVLHCEEKHIDVNYHWNEWELRRRALQRIKLQNCATSAQQTDESHFRRHNETMLYIQRHNWTQTKRSKATNPPIKTTFVAGLRGKVATGDPVSKFMSKAGLEVGEAAKPRVVTLTLDL